MSNGSTNSNEKNKLMDCNNLIEFEKETKTNGDHYDNEKKKEKIIEKMVKLFFFNLIFR